MRFLEFTRCSAWAAHDTPFRGKDFRVGGTLALLVKLEIWHGCARLGFNVQLQRREKMRNRTTLLSLNLSSTRNCALCSRIGHT